MLILGGLKIIKKEKNGIKLIYQTFLKSFREKNKQLSFKTDDEELTGKITFNNTGMTLILYYKAKKIYEIFADKDYNFFHSYRKFLSFNPSTGLRLHAQCPSCKALERHRLQYLVFQEVMDTAKACQLSFLHVVLEKFFKEKFNNLFSLYHNSRFNDEKC